MSTRSSFLLLCVLLSLAAGGSLPAAAQTASAIVPGFDAQAAPRFDDGGIGPVALGFEIDLFGRRTSNVFVNNNGNVTFDQALFTYTPFSLLQTQQLIIAPFFADVDTSAAGDVMRFGAGSFQGRRAFGVTWSDVDYYPSTPNHSRRNSFQLILVERGDRGSGDFDIVFNYARIQWETGDASGGIDGRGGNSARAGYAIGGGAPGSAFELEGSAVNGEFLDGGRNALTAGRRGSSVPGRYIFEIRASNRAAQVSSITPFADAPSFSATSESNGRFVVYQSQAGNLVTGGQRGRNDIYRTDTVTGETRRLSVDSAGAPVPGGAFEPEVSGDGTFAVFVGGALPGAAAKTTSAQVLLHNLVTQTTQQVAPAAGSGQTTPRVSASGNMMVYTRTVTAASQGQVGQENVFVRTLQRDGDVIVHGPEICVTCKSINADGSDSGTNSDGISRNAVLNADGTVVAWETGAKNTIAGTPPTCAGSGSDIVLRNLLTGAAQRVSQPSSAAACSAGGSRAPAIDFDGNTLVFESDLGLQAGDQNGVADIYRLDTGSGTLTRVSRPTNGDSNGASSSPSISGDGRVVAYTSAATNLDASASDGNGKLDIHVALPDSGQTRRLSLTDSGAESDGDSFAPALNFDGSLVVFESNAGNLAAGAAAGQLGVFQRANPLVAPSDRVKSATWWNASESGWGLFTIDQGSAIAAGWFTFDGDGEPTWFLIPGATLQDDGSYATSLLRFTGTPLAQIAGNASDAPVTIGSAVLRFVGEDRLNFQYTVGATTQNKMLVKFPFGSRDLVCRESTNASRADATNFSDLWSSPGSAGWGVHVSHLGDSLFASWYTYDTDREATYFIAPMTRQSAGTFTGPLVRQRNGTPFLQIDGTIASGGAALPAGTATLVFSDGENASFNYTVDGSSQSKALRRSLFGSTASVCEDVATTSSPASAKVALMHQPDEVRVRIKRESVRGRR